MREERGAEGSPESRGESNPGDSFSPSPFWLRSLKFGGEGESSPGAESDPRLAPEGEGTGAA